MRSGTKRWSGRTGLAAPAWLMALAWFAGCPTPGGHPVHDDDASDDATGDDDTGPPADDDSADDDDATAPALGAGFRASRYGIQPFPEPGDWSGAATQTADGLQDASPAGIWIVGVARDGGECGLDFPSPGGSYPDIEFAGEDQNEAYLQHFDDRGVSVWLQVEPGDADVPTLIDLVLDRYGHHPSVIGFGVDVEWYRWSDVTWRAPVSDVQAAAWRDAVRAHAPGYTLFLKHWMTAWMPPGERDGLLFVDDSQGFGGLGAMVSEFGAWGGAFAPAPVAFQFGYEADAGWWSGLDDPPVEIGDTLVGAIDNTAGLFWVDFTIDQVFPR